MNLRHLFIVITACVSVFTAAAQPIDLTHAVMLSSPGIKSPVRETAMRVLSEEVQKRTNLLWKEATKWNGEHATVIALALSSDEKLGSKAVPSRENTSLPEYKAEGYRLVSRQEKGQSTIWIIGHDARGVLFGIGQLLRTMHMSEGKAHLPQFIDMATAPRISHPWAPAGLSQYRQFLRCLDR